MGKVLLTAICLILFSQKAWAETVFYCSGTHTVQFKDDKLKSFKPDNFKFTANEKRIKFGNKGFMSEVEIPIKRWVDETMQFAATENVTIKLHKAYYGLTANFVGKKGVIVRLMTATCDKF